MDIVETTPRQHELVRKLHELTVKTGNPPTIRELGQAMRMSSTNAVVDMMEICERKGLVRREALKQRTLQLTDAGRRAIGLASCTCACHGKPRKTAALVASEDGWLLKVDGWTVAREGTECDDPELGARAGGLWTRSALQTIADRINAP